MPLCWKHVVPAVSSPSQFDDPSIIRTVGYPTWRLHFPASDTLCFQPFDSAGQISKVLAEPSGVTQLRRTSSVFNLLSCSNSEFRSSTGWFLPCCLGIWPIPTTLYICLELSFDRQMALGRSWRTIRPPPPIRGFDHFYGFRGGVINYYKHLMVLEGNPEYAHHFNKSVALSASHRGFLEVQWKAFRTWWKARTEKES